MIRRSCAICLVVAAGSLAVEAKDLSSIVTESGVSGGVVVHVDARDLGQIVALVRSGDFLVHGLYTDAGKLRKARAYISANGLAGKVTVSHWDGEAMPFVGSSVNVVIIEGNAAISDKEAMRIATPRGRIVRRAGGRWQSTIKAVPDSIDDWTHNLYDASNVAVSKDMEAGSPRHLQWATSPRFCRSHDANNSFQAMVSCAGRIYYIMDEGSKAFLSLPSKWYLTARDGFNGKLLWKKKLPQPLVTHLDHLKSGIGNLAHRIVAQEDKVYVTMGFNAPVSALDSRTGKEIWVSKESTNAEELVLRDGLLFCVVNLAKESRSKHPYQTMSSYNRMRANKIPRKVVALDAKSGSKVWDHVPKTLLPLSLTVGENGLFFHDSESIVSLDPKTGKQRWRSNAVDYWRDLMLYSGVNLVLHRGTLLFSCGQDSKNYRSRKKENTVTALDADTGRILWTTAHKQVTNYFTSLDLMIADGLIWSAPIFHPSGSGKYIGIDPKTGKVVREFKPDTAKHMPHHRCHRNRGTERFLFTGRTGVDVFDVRAGRWTHDYWVRGTCRYGMMPANGMLYVPPNSCACYVGALIRGFNAMTAGSPDRRVPTVIPDKGRLIRGSEWGKTPAVVSSQGDWPTYRGSVSRHGMAESRMSAEYGVAWKAPLKGRLTQPVIAGGKVLVSSMDQHTVHALDENTGKLAWSFLAGGRVNSTPTIWQGRALFGCRDGWVYCLALRNGGLIWKYRAAPVERRVVAYEQLESAWPVDGAVLVLPGRAGKANVYCVAGRSMFLDGGMRMVVLDAATGSKIAETRMDHINPKTGKSIQAGAEWPPDIPTALPDILSYAKGRIYMGMQPFSTDGKRQEIYYPKRTDYFDHRKKVPAQKKKDTTYDHLYATTGFLDDQQWHRAIWQFGSDSTGSCWSVNIPAFVCPSGNILCVDDTSVYGYGREFFVEGKKATAHLFGVDKHPDVATVKRLKGKKVEIRGPYVEKNIATTPLWAWSKKIDVYVRAMVVARNVEPKQPNLIIAAGAPDVIEEYDAMDLIRAQQRKGFNLGKIYKKEKAVAGKLGATLIVVSSRTGDILSQTTLDSPPIFDGMSAANGRIFIANMNGKVVCLKPADQ